MFGMADRLHRVAQCSVNKQKLHTTTDFEGTSYLIQLDFLKKL